MTPFVPASLRALLAGSVDYAGLFPPAELALGPALENHAAYVRGENAWMLGRFVLPTAKLTEAASLLAGKFDPTHPLRVSALGTKTDSAGEVLESLSVSLSALIDLWREHQGAWIVDQIGTPLPPGIVHGPELGMLLWEATGMLAKFLPGRLRTFWEVRFSEDLPTTLRGFADHHSRTPLSARWHDLPRFDAVGQPLNYPPTARTDRCLPFGVKLRTGGIEAAAFPTCEQLAAALVAARDAGVAVKFTAGLHHALRHFDEALGTQMHGFLNVFAAGVLAREHRLDAMETRAILEDEQPESFRFDAEGFAWRNRRVPTTALAAHRKFITSFGSCSFDEPCDDLRRLGLLL